MALRILYFAPVNLNRPNAVQTHTLGLLRGFSLQGARVTAVLTRPERPLPSWPGVTYYYTGPFRGGRRHLPRAVVRSSLILWRLCRWQQFDAIYARDMDVFIGPRLCSSRFQLPLFLEIDDTPVEGEYPALVRRLVEQNLRSDYHQACGLIVPSVPRSRILQERFQVPAAKIHVVLNGADEIAGPMASPAAAKARLGLPAASFCLGYVGTVNDRYDFATMLRATARCQTALPNLRFILIGDGPCRPAVQQLVQQLGLEDRVLFTGFVQPDRFPELLPALDLGLMVLTPSALAEHGPIHTKLATYGLFNMPVITAAESLAGYPDGLSAGLVLVPPGDPDRLADVILGLVQAPQRRQATAAALQDFVRRKLTWRAVAGEILAIMAQAIAAPRL
ncbi:MAG: glycosyltransferase family 4 protein [Desulfobacca sp.]|uniref:glycosyltransferase family 4 protein n=1 Tax=Desulfobacca sp. TaxID=2067990 RepID=UPI004049C857